MCGHSGWSIKRSVIELSSGRRKCYRAKCDCGWLGNPRLTLNMVASDILNHRTENNNGNT